MMSLFLMENVTVVRDGKRILGPLDLTVDEGESIAVIGRNGSGKTTLSKLMKGEISPYYDTLAHSVMKIMDRDDWNIFDLKKTVVSVSSDDEDFFSRSTTVAEILLTGYFGSDAVYPIHKITDDMVARAKDISRSLGISELLDREFSTLSQGERRAAIIARAFGPGIKARAMIAGPKAMILDEPTNSLDPIAAGQLIDMIGRMMGQNISVIMITHRLEDIPKGIDRIIGIRDGLKVADGKKEEVLSSEVISEIYGSPAEVRFDDGVYSLRILPTNL